MANIEPFRKPQTIEEKEEAICFKLNRGDYNIEQLVREFHPVTKYRILQLRSELKATRKLKRRNARLEKLENEQKQIVEQPKLPTPKPPWNVGHKIWGSVSFLVGVGFGSVNLIINTDYFALFGTDDQSRWIMRGVGIGFDLGAMMGPTLRGILWEKKYKGSAISITLVSIVCVGMSGLAAYQYGIIKIKDTLKGRETTELQYNITLSDLKNKQERREALTKLRKPSDIENDIQNEILRVPSVSWIGSKKCTDITSSWNECRAVKDLRKEKENVERAPEQIIELDAQIIKLSDKLGTYKNVSSRNPGTNDTISWYIELFQSLVMACLTLIGSMLIATGRKLWK